jgi:hypothetical protein
LPPEYGFKADMDGSHSFSDCRAIFGARAAIDRQIESYMKASVTPKVVRRVAVVVGDPVEIAVPSGATDYSLMSRNGTRRYTYQCDVRYVQPISDALISTMILKYFGIKDIVSASWELVPFSFVIDWFTDHFRVLAGRGDTFATMEALAPMPEYVISNGCWSVKTRTEAKNAVHQTIAGYTGGFTGQIAATVVEESYVRSIGLPPDSGGVISPHLNLVRLTDGCALLRVLKR